MDNNRVAAGAGLVAGAGAVAGVGLVAGAGAVAGVVAAPMAAAVVAPAAADAVVVPAAAAGGGGVALSAAQMAMYREIDVMYELDQEVVPYEYEIDDDVDVGNFQSYVQRQLARFLNGDLRVMRREKYVCPFCPYKVKDGQRASLEYHAMDTCHSPRQEMQGRADHEALGRFLMGPRLPRYGRILRNM